MCSSSVETLESTAETLPYVDGEPRDFDLRSIPSTVCLSDSEDEIELQTHHVVDERPLAPLTVISETVIQDVGQNVTNEFEVVSDMFL